VTFSDGEVWVVIFTLNVATVQFHHYAAVPLRQTDSMVTNETPEEKPLQPASFVIHVTRGVIRDQKTRRRVMVLVLTAAIIVMIFGATILRKVLDPHERPGWFLFYWLVCAWLTMTAILLALFDLLMLRIEARKAERDLRKEMENASSGTSGDL
jgi:uncharacterized ion transporter superfamily protein YfcC